MHNANFVIITGLSGAGKSQAVKVFEDMGYFCIDNLPAPLIPKFADLCSQASEKFFSYYFSYPFFKKSVKLVLIDKK